MGHTLRWSDLLAVIKHMPDGSHFRQALAQLATPEEEEPKTQMTASELRAAVSSRKRRKVD